MSPQSIQHPNLTAPPEPNVSVEPQSAARPRVKLTQTPGSSTTRPKREPQFDGQSRAESADCAVSAELLKEFDAGTQTASNFSGLLFSLGTCLAKQPGVLAVWVITEEMACDDAGAKAWKTSGIHPLLGKESETLWQSFEQPIRHTVARATEAGLLVNHALNDSIGPEICAMSTNIEQRRLTLVGVFDNAREPGLRPSVSPAFTVSHLVERIRRWTQHARLRHADETTRIFTAASSLNSAILQTSNRTEALLVFVNSLRMLTGANQVSLALINGKSITLSAISDVESFDTNSANCQAMQAVINNTIVNARTVFWPNSDCHDSDADDISKRADEVSSAYCRQTGNKACSTALLMQGEETIGVVLLAFAEPESVQNKSTQAEQICSLSAGSLANTLQLHQPISCVLRKRVSERISRRLTIICATVALLICGLMCVPWSIHIGASSEMQPVLRRFIAAPHDGILKKSLVDNGDIVQRGQVLAVLDGRNLRMELASLNAEYSSQRKQRDASLATKDVARSQIAQLEMRRLDAEIDLIRQRLDNLEITSPIDGVVINGDLENAEGAPLSIGQNLFEVSPLGEMQAEIAIPESEINYARIDQAVTIKLDAFPFQTWEGHIQRINPHAEVLDGKSVFVAEVRFENDLGRLKPGMKGRASVVGDRYPLGWTLVRKPWEQIRTLLIW